MKMIDQAYSSMVTGLKRTVEHNLMPKSYEHLYYTTRFDLLLLLEHFNGDSWDDKAKASQNLAATFQFSLSSHKEKDELADEFLTCLSVCEAIECKNQVLEEARLARRQARFNHESEANTSNITDNMSNVATLCSLQTNSNHCTWKVIIKALVQAWLHRG
jgi:hypothetical protein